MRKILDTFATILFTFAAIGFSLLVAGVAGYLSSLFICLLVEIFLGWEISYVLGIVIAMAIAIGILISFWGGLLFKKK